MTPQKPIIASINTNLIGKSDSQTLTKYSAHGWHNDSFTFDEFKAHLIAGHAYGYQWYNGRRKNENYLSSTILSADFDSGDVTLAEVLDNDFIKKNAAFVYKTAGYTEEVNKFRVIFVTPRKIPTEDEIEVLNVGLHSKIAQEFPLADPNKVVDRKTTDPARFFFGVPNTLVLAQELEIGYPLLDELFKLGSQHFNSEEILIKRTQPENNHLNKDILVKLANGAMRPLYTLRVHQSIHCPFHSPDNSRSAYVINSQRGVLGVHCHSCNQSWFVEKTPPEKFDFFKIDSLIRSNAGKANNNVTLTGLTKLFPELDASHSAFNFKVMNQKFLGQLPSHRGIHLIKSPKGTGKTEALKKLVEFARFKPDHLGGRKNKAIPLLLIGHRQALLKESSEKLGLTCYLDSEKYDTLVKEDRRDNIVKMVTGKPSYYAICLDSLHSRMRLDREDYPIVVIDESEQLFSHFSSETMKRTSASNFKILSRLIAKASHVYCLDADMGEITLSGVLTCLKQDALAKSKDKPINVDEVHRTSEIYFYLNEYKRKAEDLEVFQNKTHLKYDLAKSLHDKKKCFVASNSKGEIDALYKSLSTKIPHSKILKITADNSGDEDIRNKVRNIKQTMKEYDAILSSPSMGTGIDITYENEDKVVDCVYGFFSSKVNTHFDIDQQLGRVRHPRSVKVWVDSNNQKLPVVLSLIRDNLLDEMDVALPHQHVSSDGVEYQLSETPFIDLQAKIRQIRNESQNNFKNNFIEYKQWQGWNVREKSKNSDAYGRGNELEKIGKLLVENEYIESILSAELISTDEMDFLIRRQERNESLSSSEKISMNKFWMSRFYKTEITEDLLVLDNKGHFRESVMLYESLTQHGIEYLKTRRDIHQYHWDRYKELSKIGMDITDKALFLKKAFEAAGIYKDGKFILNAIWDQSALENFKFFCNDKNNIADMDRLFHMGIRGDIENKTATQLHLFLKLAGISILQIQKNYGGGVSRYSFNASSIDVLTNMVEARKSLKLASKAVTE